MQHLRALYYDRLNLHRVLVIEAFIDKVLPQGRGKPTYKMGGDEESLGEPLTPYCSLSKRIFHGGSGSLWF